MLSLPAYAPTGMRGRVMSLYTLIAAGLTPLGVAIVALVGYMMWLHAY